MSQNSQILAHLKGGKTITSLEALHKYGCFRLASRIDELRGDNDILTTMIERNGKRIASYSLGSRK